MGRHRCGVVLGDQSRLKNMAEQSPVPEASLEAFGRVLMGMYPMSFCDGRQSPNHASLPR